MLLNGMKYSEIDVIILKVWYLDGVCIPSCIMILDFMERLTLKMRMFLTKTRILGHVFTKPKPKVVMI